MVVFEGIVRREAVNIMVLEEGEAPFTHRMARDWGAQEWTTWLLQYVPGRAWTSATPVTSIKEAQQKVSDPTKKWVYLQLK